MAGGIRIEPYKPLGVSTQAVPGGGYINVDASAGNFAPSPWLQLGLQTAQGVAGIAGTVAEQLAGDNEAAVKIADTKLGETEQALLFDPQNGYLNLQGLDAVSQAPAVLDAYGKAQDQVMATMVDDDQRRMLDGIARSRNATFADLVNQHADAQRQVSYDRASDQRIALMQADAGLNWNNDALLRRALGTVRAEVGEQASRKGWDTALTDAALRQQTSRTLVSTIGAAAERDPERARSLRARYAAVLEDHDSAALDALLSEAQARERAAAASTEILNATPSDGAQPTPDWRLRQAEAITEPSVRAATIRRLNSAAAADNARARALGEQVLARVLKGSLTDPSQIPVREWVTLDAERRQAIGVRLDHNAAGTEPALNVALVDELATEMTQAPYTFASRDLVPVIAHLPLPKWQRFRDWQAGIRRNDVATQDELYAIKRGLQLAEKMLPAELPNDVAVNYRAGLVDELDTAYRIAGKNPDDAAIAEMLRRVAVPPATFHLLQARTPSRYGRVLNPMERAWVFQYDQALQRIYRYDPGHREIQSPTYVPTPRDIARTNDRADSYGRIHQFFEVRNITVQPHAYREIHDREGRGITRTSILEAYNNGRIYYDPGPRDPITGRRIPNRGDYYIRYDPKTDVSVVVTSPTGGEIVTVFNGPPQARWVHVPYR